MTTVQFLGVIVAMLGIAVASTITIILAVWKAHRETHDKIDAKLDKMATKDDMSELRLSLEKQIADSRISIENQLIELRKSTDDKFHLIIQLLQKDK